MLAAEEDFGDGLNCRDLHIWTVEEGGGGRAARLWEMNDDGDAYPA